jgi:integrase
VTMPKKKARYGDYCEIIDGKLYASVNLPLGGGKYKKKRKLVENKTEARNWALAELAKYKSGEQPTEKMKFSDLAAWYKTEFLIAPFYKDGKKMHGLRTFKRQQVILERLEKTFGFYLLDKLTVDVLRRYKRERLKTVSITPINREFALMRTMLKKAKARKWIKENPFDLGENLIEIALEGDRQIRLDTRTAKRLVARARKSEQPLLFYLVLVAMHTGARPSELMPFEAYKEDLMLREPLTWKNILEFDFKAVRLISYKGRAKKERIVPASDELEKGLRQMFDQYKPNENDLLFPVRNFKRSWKTLTRSVGCEGIWLRDFRAYFNTYLINSNVDQVSRLLILGHVEVKTNLRYSHINKEFIDNYRKALKKLV